MMAEGTPPAATPTLADQVSKLYELVAGYHATNLLEIARELGVWEALTQSPGLTSEALAGPAPKSASPAALPASVTRPRVSMPRPRTPWYDAPSKLLLQR